MGYEAPKDYNEVQSRILEFRDKHPEGSLQSDDPIWVRDGSGEIIGVTVRTHAYRTPDDARPGQGLAYEVFPGKTNFTRGSEVMNAETSSWGRALIAVGAADAKKGIASANEVRGAQAANSTPSGGKKTAQKSTQAAKTPPKDQPVSVQSVGMALGELDVPPADVKEFISMLDGKPGGLSECKPDQLDAVLAWAKDNYGK